MKIYPAIDLMDGQCVRLYQGRFDQRTDYPGDPLALAREYQNAGAECLHVVDLDAARDNDDGDSHHQLDVITDLVRDLDIPLQTGGGVRTETDLALRFQAGCQRVVVGSLAVRNPRLFGQWLRRYGAERLVAALDVRQDEQGIWRPAVKGWQEEAAMDLLDLLEQLSGYGLRHLLCTDISRDGVLGGPNVDLYRMLAQRFPMLHVQASGGVGALSDLAPLQACGAAGVVVGKALLEGRFTLDEALNSLAGSTCR